MTIHHDKLAYGKLASMQEDISEDKLLKMLKTLSEEGEKEGEEEEKTALSEKDEKGGK